MKTIAIDARLISQTGVGVYTKNLIEELQNIKTDLKFLVYIRSKDKKKIKILKSNFILKYADIQWHTFNEQVFFYYYLIKDKPDLVHFTYFSFPFLYKKPFIITIHDLTPLLFKTGRASTKNKIIYEIKHKAYTWLIKKAIINSKAIITPTKTVKKQIETIFGNKISQKIFHIYEGVDIELKNVRPVSPKTFDIKSQYFLYIGNFYPHKNIERLIEAFNKIRTKTHLVLAGPKDYFFERINKICADINNEKIHLYSDISKEEIAFLYTRAKAFIHPSLSEGFGLPLLEATYFNCPVIASNIEVFDEILGKERIKFNPSSIESIKNSILEFEMLKEDERKKIVKKDILRKFSFKEMTRQTLKLYKKILLS